MYPITDTKPNKNPTEEEKNALYKAYARERIELCLPQTNVLNRELSRAMFGPNYNAGDIRISSVDAFDFAMEGSPAAAAKYSMNDNSVTFYRPSYDMFKGMLGAKYGDRSALKREFDTTAGHELGHAVLMGAIKKRREDIADRYMKGAMMSPLQYMSVAMLDLDGYLERRGAIPRWLAYKYDEGAKLQESLAEVIGYSTSAHVNSMASDNDSVAREMLGQVGVEAGSIAATFGQWNGDFEKYVKLEGLAELAEHKVTHASDYEIRAAGRERMERVCKDVKELMLFYTMPRLGIAAALARHPTESLANFIKNALGDPAELGIGVSKYILDKDGDVAEMNSKFAEANLQGKIKILMEKSREIATAAEAEAELRYPKGER